MEIEISQHNYKYSVMYRIHGHDLSPSSQAAHMVQWSFSLFFSSCFLSQLMLPSFFYSSRPFLSTSVSFFLLRPGHNTPHFPSFFLFPIFSFLSFFSSSLLWFLYSQFILFLLFSFIFYLFLFSSRQFLLSASSSSSFISFFTLVSSLSFFTLVSSLNFFFFFFFFFFTR